MKLLTTIILLCFSLGVNGQSKPVLSHRIQETQLSLSWTPTIHADAYRIYYAPLPYEGPQTVGSLDVGTSTSLSGQLPVGAQYGIAVTGLANGIESNWSNIALINVASSDTVTNIETSYRNPNGQNFHKLSFPVVGWEKWTSTVNGFAFDDFRETGLSDLATLTIRYDTAANYSSVLKFDEDLGHNVPVTDSLSSLARF